MSTGPQGPASGHGDPLMGLGRSDASVVQRQWRIDIDDGPLARLVAIGRTEDVAVSPDGRRLALPGFFTDVVVLVDFELDRERTVVRLTRVTTLRNAQLAQPHGVAFLDAATLLVANREGALVALHLPADGSPDVVDVESRVVADRTTAVPVWGPGSVVVRSAGGDLFELIACNNHAHQVVRYVVDRRHDLAVVDQEVLIGSGLQIPDGLAISPSGEWLALSNHETHEVFVYRYGPELRADAPPAGVLSGANFPHGMQFVGDHRLLVNDAGLPFVYAFAAGDGDWSGTRSPVNIARVMDDETFNAGRYNPREGGPKGMALLRGGGPVVLTSERQQLAWFTPADLLGSGAVDAVGTNPATPAHDPSAALARVAVLRLAVRGDEQAHELERLSGRVESLTAHASALAADRDAAAARADALDEEVVRLRTDVAVAQRERAEALGAAETSSRELALVRASRSWRITAPLRRAGDAVRAVLRGR